MKLLKDEELKSVSGGFGPAVVLVPLGIYAAKQAWEHSDQIYQGYKKGTSKY